MRAAGFAALIRILVQALGPLSDDWRWLIGVLAVLTMAFGVLGLAGVFKKHMNAGIVVMVALRYAIHVLSGVLFFYLYAVDLSLNAIIHWIYRTLGA